MHRARRFSRANLAVATAVSLVSLLISFSSPAEAGRLGPAIPVQVELVGDDALTDSLGVALENAISSKEGLIVTRDLNEQAYLISSDTNVNWDTLAGKAVVIYHVKLLKSGETIGDKVGACFEANINKCARDITVQFAGIIFSRR